MLLKDLFFNLRHFDGDGEGAGAIGAEGAETGGEGIENENTEDLEERDADVAEGAPDREKEFEALIKGDYKEAFAKRTQRIMNKRYAESKANEEKLTGQLSEYEDVLSVMYDRYGVSDVKALKAAMESDDDLISEKAAEAGMSNDAYRKYSKLKAAQDKADKAQRASEIAKEKDRLLAREAEIKQKFPEFDLMKELKNPEFEAMVRQGADMEQVYKALHYEELMTGAIKTAKTKAKMEAAADISARGRRPRENGVGKVTPGVPKFDINNTTKEQREKIERAVLKGEKVTLDKIPEILSRK